MLLLAAACSSTDPGDPTAQSTVPTSTVGPTDTASAGPTASAEPTGSAGPSMTGAPSGSAGPSSAPGVSGSQLAAALAQVAPATDGGRPYFEYGNTKTLVALSAKDKGWIGLEAAGMGSLGSYARVVKDVLGIDPLAADWAVSVNNPPAAVTLLRGGQDAALIAERAGKGGWTGTDVLSTKMDASKKDYASYTVVAPRIRPMGTDVAYGGISSKPEQVDVTATGADQVWADAVACLGDVVAATGAGALPAFDSPVAVGVRVEGEAATGVICLVQSSEQQAQDRVAAVKKDLADGSSRTSRQPWSKVLPDAQVDTVGPVVRITSTGQPVTASRVFSMLAQSDFPGGRG